MSSVEKKSKCCDDHHGGRISIEQARNEILRWKDHCDAAPYHHTRAFFIPMDDIKSLFENYNGLNPTGVRAYIGLKEHHKEGCSPLRLLLVPATEDTDFYNCHEHCADKSEDEHDAADAGDSSVYDFTMPCPDACANDNGLNS